MSTLEEAYQWMQSYEEFDTAYEFRCILGQLAELQQRDLLASDMIQNFERAVLDSWQKVLSVFHLLDSFTLIRETANQANINSGHSCTIGGTSA